MVMFCPPDTPGRGEQEKIPTRDPEIIPILGVVAENTRMTRAYRFFVVKDGEAFSPPFHHTRLIFV